MSDRGPWIETCSGRQFHLADPRPEDFDISDIAHALARVNRYTGHTTESWSVGQHCVVAAVMAGLFYPVHPLLPRQMLLHDASEAYLNDISSPLKSLLSEYRALETKCERALEVAFDTPYISVPLVKEIDLRMLVTERARFMPNQVGMWVMSGRPETYISQFVNDGRVPHWWWKDLWTPWTPDTTKSRYMLEYRRLACR